MPSLRTIVTAASVLLTGIAHAVPAGIVLTTLEIQQNFFQSSSGVFRLMDPVNGAPASLTGPGGLLEGVGGNAKVVLTAYTGSPADFSSLSVTVPGSATPIAIPYAPEFNPGASGYGSSVTFNGFANVAALNAVFPTGAAPYVFTGEGGSVGFQQASLFYTANHPPSARPQLTAPTYAGLQGMDSRAAFLFNFNSFTGDAAQLSNGLRQPYTELVVFDRSPAIADVVYTSGRFAGTQTSHLLPGDTLLPGHRYGYALVFGNGVNVTCSGAAGTTCGFLGFENYTFGLFDAAAGTQPTRSLANVHGGSRDNPTPLPIGSTPIGAVSGEIGQAPSSQFYEFFWNGGAFEASVEVEPSDPRESFLFELVAMSLDGIAGEVIQSLPFDSLSDFAATITHYGLAAGRYGIGLVATSPFDPPFTISFDTPVQGVVDEPASLALVVSLLLIGAAVRRPRHGCSAPAA